MKVSRRGFVSTASCAAAASLCAIPSFGFAASNSVAKDAPRCALLDLKSNCALAESVDGMRFALGDSHRCVAESELVADEFVANGIALLGFSSGKFSSSAGALIVAGAGAVPPETFGAVAALVAKGTRVVWESGAGFIEPRDFAEQQALAREYFGISIGQPVDVWSRFVARKSNSATKHFCERTESARYARAIGHERVPYVAYRSPRESHIRDFSRVIPVSAAYGDAIAHWGEVSVAWRKSIGAGTLTFLGSPIGPALRAGDSEAASLFRAMIATS
jgi:hypothetical protein